jgi:hypothetical protein
VDLRMADLKARKAKAAAPEAAPAPPAES